MGLTGTLITGMKVRNLCFNLIPFEIIFVGEPDRKNYGKLHHECTFLSIEGQQGRGHRGFWWDGVCSWSTGGFDCLCKK